MAKHRHSRRHHNRTLRRILMLPIVVVVNIWQSLRDVFDLTLSTIGLKHRRPRRYNRDFERAGKEVPHVDAIDSGSLKRLKKAGKSREDEVLEQVRYERKTLGRKNREAEELRKNMESDNVSVSQGEAISHLAKVNQLHAKKAKKKKSTDKKSED